MYYWLLNVKITDMEAANPKIIEMIKPFNRKYSLVFINWATVENCIDRKTSYYYDLVPTLRP